MCCTAPTVPASSVAPSMIAASSSLSPPRVKTAPRPALKSGESSMITMAACTASIARPPPCSTPYPARSAWVSAFRYFASCAGVMSLRRIVPAPPWITMAMGCLPLESVAPSARAVPAKASHARRRQGSNFRIGQSRLGISARLGPAADLVYVAQEVGRIFVYPHGAGALELVLAIAARKEAHSEAAGAPRGQHVPDAVADDDCRLYVGAQACGGREEKIGIG